MQMNPAPATIQRGDAAVWRHISVEFGEGFAPS